MEKSSSIQIERILFDLAIVILIHRVSLSVFLIRFNLIDSIV